VFPELIGAWEVGARQPWGIDMLRALVKAELDGVEQGLDFTAVTA